MASQFIERLFVQSFRAAADFALVARAFASFGVAPKLAAAGLRKYRIYLGRAPSDLRGGDTVPLEPPAIPSDLRGGDTVPLEPPPIPSDLRGGDTVPLEPPETF